MSLVSLVVTLVVVGVLLWALNALAGEYIDGKILRVINIVVIVCVVLWIVGVIFGYGQIGSIRVPTAR